MGIPDPDRDPQFYQGVPVRRLMAFCIDFLVILALWITGSIIGLIIAVVTLGLAAPLMVFFVTSLDFLYRWLMLSQRSATLGMLATGIEVRDADGNRCSAGMALLHTAAFYATVFFLPLLIIGWILMAASPHRRAMHDIVLGSVVINRPV